MGGRARFESGTDEDGWSHANCSWESGQDASKRLLVDGDPGAGNPGGCENYGWGATLPMNIIRNVILAMPLDSPGATSPVVVTSASV